MSTGLDNLKHMVVLMMENRSFDHMFGFLKKENPDVRGVVGGDYFNPTTANVGMPVTDGALYQGQYVMDREPGKWCEYVIPGQIKAAERIGCPASFDKRSKGAGRGSDSQRLQPSSTTLADAGGFGGCFEGGVTRFTVPLGLKTF